MIWRLGARFERIGAYGLFGIVCGHQMAPTPAGEGGILLLGHMDTVHSCSARCKSCVSGAKGRHLLMAPV